ncbi:hypothetical protein D9M71_257010 [compost metagenome]
MTSHVRKLLSRGDEICIDVGRLAIYPASGKPVPKNWLKKYSLGLIWEILITLEIDVYQYCSYKTGHYGKQKLPGVTLQFLSLVAGESTYTIFNADLTRSRTTEAGEKGSPLPDGHFRVGERSHFYRFWISTRLAVPRSLTSFHDYMGKLRDILFTADRTEDHENRMNAGSLRPLIVPAEAVRKAFLSDNLRTTRGQTPDNIQTRMPDKDSAQPHEARGFQANATTRMANHGKAVASERGDKGPVLPPPRRQAPQEQHWEDWLEDYSRPEQPDINFTQLAGRIE